MRFFSSAGQDRFLLEHFFKARRGGVFVEIGTPESDSNTLLFEKRYHGLARVSVQ